MDAFEPRSLTPPDAQRILPRLRRRIAASALWRVVAGRVHLVETHDEEERPADEPR